MRFGEKLLKLRTSKNLKQEDVATAVGITRRTYISYEAEGRYPRKRELYKKFADVLGCDTNYLLTEDEDIPLQPGETNSTQIRLQAERLAMELSDIFANSNISESEIDSIMLSLQKAYWDRKDLGNK